MDFGNITAYDIVVAGLFLLLVGRGLWLGFLKQVIGLLSLYLGYIVASQYHDRLFPVLREVSENPKVVFLTTYVILFIITYVLAMLAGKGLAYVIQITITGWFDRLLGGILGFAKALLLVIMMHMILATLLAPENRMLRDCSSCKVLDEAVTFTRELIKSEDVREALRQKTPAISTELFSPEKKKSPPVQ